MGVGPGQSAEPDSDENGGTEGRASPRRDRTPETTGDDIGARFSRPAPSHAGPDDHSALSALTLDDVVGPPPGALDPGGFEFSPDNEHVAYLHAHLPHDPASAWTTWTLVVLDVASGTRHACFDPSSTPVSARGAGGTDVEREHASGVGVTRYEWASEATNPSRLLVPRPEGAYVVDVEKTSRGKKKTNDVDKEKTNDERARFPTTRVSYPRCVARASSDAPVLDASISPDGRWVAFVRRSEIHVAPCDDVSLGGSVVDPPVEFRVTHGARGRPFVTHGLAEYVAAEEMQRDRGFWWRPDSGAIAFTRVDSTHVEVVDVTRGYALNMGDDERSSSEDNCAEMTPAPDERHSYPHAGCENARVTLGVVDVSSLTLVPTNDFRTKKPDATTTMRRAAEVSGDPEFFPTTWMDVDCGSARRGTAKSRGEEEEYLASVAWTPTVFSGEEGEKESSASKKKLKKTRGKGHRTTSSNGAESFSLFARVQNRAQTEVRAFFVDPATGQRYPHLDPAFVERVEGTDTWVNIAQTPIVLRRGKPPFASPGDLVGVSERDGFAHLYLFPVGKNAKRPPRRLTAGAWCVLRVIAVDENRGWVYFTANERGPLERHLYRARLWPAPRSPPWDENSFGRSVETTSANGDASSPVSSSTSAPVAPPVRLTRAAGCHTVSIDHAFRRFVDVREDLRTPPVAAMRVIARSKEDDDRDCRDDAEAETGTDADDAFARTLSTAALRSTTSTYAATYASYKAPVLMQVTSADGHTTLHGAIYLPDAERFGPGPYPCAVAVYGGPGAQCVSDSWRLTADARAQRLREKGVVTFKLDNRGSANRGCAFERAIRANDAVLGECEVADQVAGVRFLVSKNLVDPKRVAIVGWSYGGFVAAAALLRAPETFVCAVAGAPVTSWLAYNAHYAERYLGAPNDPGNDERYERCDLVAATREQTRRGGWRRDDRLGADGKRKKKMLIAHGASDENVHLSHTARLAHALEALDDADRASVSATSATGATEEEEEKNAAKDDGPSSSSASVERGSSTSRENKREESSFEVVVFARERHVPRGRGARRALEARIDAFLERAFD